MKYKLMLLTALCCGLFCSVVYSQTISTANATSGYAGDNVLLGNQAQTFVIENTNSYAIVLTGVQTFVSPSGAPAAGSTFTLWYSATSLSGAVNIVSPAWTQVATNTPATLAAGYTPVISGISFLIPANTQYRFALQSTSGIAYSTSGTPNPSPSILSGAGVNLKNGDAVVNGSAVGYVGGFPTPTLTPRWFTGAISFLANTACAGTPAGGNISSASGNTVCNSTYFTLNLTNSTATSGTTYQWQSSLTNSGFTNINGAVNPTLFTAQNVSTYYRVAVTCGGNTVYSDTFFMSSPALVSGTYTINNTVPASSTNFQSFNAAYGFIRCGINGPVVFNVNPASGPYNEQLIMQAVPGASATNTITFNGNGRTIKYSSANSNERAVIKLNDADHIRFDSLVIDATPVGSGTTYGYGVQLINNADSNVIRRCTINTALNSTSTNYAGLVINASATNAAISGATLCDSNYMAANTITGGYYGITLLGSTTDAVQRNVIAGNNIRDFYQYGIYTSYTFSTLIDNNDISRPTATNLNTFNGIYSTGVSVGMNITRNRIHNICDAALNNTTGGYGIYFNNVDAFAGAENRIVNNLLYNLNGNGFIYAIYNVGSDNALYYHNTISLDDASSTSTFQTVGFYQTTAAAGIEFTNNLISLTKGGTGAKYAVYVGITSSQLTLNHNDYYLSNNITAYTGYFGTIQGSLQDWQNASGQDANSVNINPLYNSLVTGNYRPTAPALNDLGTPVGIGTDIEGTVRSGTSPDIGAFEFSVPACNAVPVGGTVISSVSTVCIGSSFTLNVTGASIASGLTYQWQSSTDGVSWVNIPGATGVLLTTTQSGSTYYRRVTTCTASNQSVISGSLQITSPALVSGTFTINSGGTTALPNFQSFNAAYDYIKCGINGAVVFNVTGVTTPYNEQLIMQAVPGTSVLNTVTFNGNGRTIKFSSANTIERAVIKLNDADHIRFDSLVIDATPVGTGTTYGYGVQLINNADSNVIRRCTINTALNSASTNYAGIVMSASNDFAATLGATLCDSNYIGFNTINGGYYAVTVVGGTLPNAINNNAVVGNTIRDFYNYGVYVAYANATTVEANDISRPTVTSTGIFYGIYASGTNRSLNIERNRIHNPFSAALTNTSAFYGIYFAGILNVGSTPNRVVNNLVYNVDGAGEQNGFYNLASDFSYYYHNTVSLDNATSTSTSATRGFYQTGAMVGLEFLNNIITIGRGGTGIKHAVYLNTASSAFTANRNDYFINATAGANYIGYKTSNLQTLSDWQTGTGQDANSVATNPQYTNASTGNLTPQSVVIDNIGVPVGVATDISGAIRSTTTPDPGAYEFAVPACTTPPVAGATSAVPNTAICLGATVRLSLPGATTGSGQTVQWQFAATATGPWTNLGGVSLSSDTIISATTTLYYRAVVTCSANSATATPVLVSVNPAMLSGFYTINPALPASATNFTSFNTAVAAMECGIAGFVTFDVSPGAYNEQVRMRRIFGAGATSRVTFRSLSGVPASVTLTSGTATATANYVLQLDSASYITVKNISIRGTNTTNARVVDLSNTASYDSISNCIITAPVSTSTANTSAGIYSGTLVGTNNVIKGNTIVNGSNGIYLSGNSAALATSRNVVDSNTINGAYSNGIYLANHYFLQVSRNTINTTIPLSTTAYSIYASNCDSAYQFFNNNITISNTTGTVYGMYFTGCEAIAAERGRIANNKVQAVTGITGSLYGLYQTQTTFNNTVNNVINVKTTAATAYGIFNLGGNSCNFWNNSVQNASPTTGIFNATASFAQSSVNGITNIQNNIFSHTGGGVAMAHTNTFPLYSDYNLLYTTGGTLISASSTNYATLQAWRDATVWDVNSIVYAPAFVSVNDLAPNIADPNVWAMHGRGTQIATNSYDVNNSVRPTTLQAGVPDLGAYEFLPTSTPVALTATPTAPVAGGTQTFTLGTDTVTRITWPAGSPVPPSVTLRRYSGILPPGVPATQQRMYFYIDADTMQVASYNATVQQNYLDPWQGFVNSQSQIRMGKTNTAWQWIINAQSQVDPIAKTITETAIPYLDKFTGLTDGTVPPPPQDTIPMADSSNRGTQFWVGYGNNTFFRASNTQDMVIYLSAEQAANVTVKVNGTNYSRTYAVPANSAVTTAPIPKNGVIDARLLTEGLSDRGINITSDVPISAYAHIYMNESSGATMLLPVSTYGYEYTSLNTPQANSSVENAYSWVNVIAAYDSTLVQITPANPTLGGRAAGVPFTILMMKGEVYQVLGNTIGGAFAYDMTGTKVLSLANASGKCYPVAVFSGSSRTGFGCTSSVLGGSSDNVIQQNFPTQAWGRRYLVAPTSTASNATIPMTNLVRIAVKDPTTVVLKNGSVLSGLINNSYYEYITGTADYIQADKPIAVAQLMVSSSGSSCPNTSGDGDPEMIYISPIEQGVKKAILYRNTSASINTQYVTLIIPTAGVASLRIDGSNTFNYTYPHPNLAGYTVVVRRWRPATAGQTVITSDSAFTAITYGMGNFESYGYNAGTLIRALNALPSFNNTLNASGAPNLYTCVKAPFRVTVQLPLSPSQIVWRFSEVANVTPNTNVVQTAPVSTGSTVINGVMYYTYSINQDFAFSDTGIYYLPVTYYSPSIEGCSGSLTTQLRIVVRRAPTADFTANPVTACVGTPIQFSGIGATPAANINRWNWSFPDATTATGQNVVKTFTTPGVKNVQLRIITLEGCIGDTIKAVTINPTPTVSLIRDTLTICPGSPDTLRIANPVAGVTYNWYTVATGGTPVFTGTAYAVTATGDYYAEAVQGACSSVRRRAVVTVYAQLIAPVAVVDSAGINVIRFRWNAVAGAVSYAVSTDNGTTWSTPSSGATGLLHTVSALIPGTSVTLLVRANGQNICQNVVSAAVTGRTLPDQLYIPNAFTPNGDGRNDVWLVYGYSVRTMHAAIFNQWGEKIFESTNQQTGWDGSYKGQQQPVGVYMYVVQLTLNDGSVISRKGSINLVR